MQRTPDEHGIHVNVTTEGNGYFATVTIPQSRTETITYYLRASSQALIMDLIRPLLRIPK